MRTTWTVCVLTLGVPLMGCDTVALGTRNLMNELALYKNDCLERSRNRELAEQWWDEFRKVSPARDYSCDFADGFAEGFVDFLDAGGTGNPPALPPARYQKVRYQTPQGLRAIEDWYDGFRTGVGAAQISGYRRFVVVPFRQQGPGAIPSPSGCGPVPVAPEYPPVQPAPEGPRPSARELAPTLPPPRKFMPPSDDRVLDRPTPEQPATLPPLLPPPTHKGDRGIELLPPSVVDPHAEGQSPRGR